MKSIQNPREYIYFNRFDASIDHIDLPQKFTFPFCYEPHPICIIAAEELQEYIRTQSEWEYDFGMNAPEDSYHIGKMFGVLVVQNAYDEIGYLAAYSGKLANSNHHNRFVPPVFDTLDPNGFLTLGMKELKQINQRVKEISNNPNVTRLKNTLEHAIDTANQEIETAREEIRVKRKERKIQRLEAQKKLSEAAFIQLKEELIVQSLRQKNDLKRLIKSWNEKVETIRDNLNLEQQEIRTLKKLRKHKSNALQRQLFESYTFLNGKGEPKDLLDIFSNTTVGKPVAGAGECAAPKLLQYAFQNQLKPISMAEFWWGRPPKSEIRKHGHYYPSCRSKCLPILGHMLEGIAVDDNPMLIPKTGVKAIKIIYEDAYMWAINKPAEFLSVPGKTPLDSVYDWMRRNYPEATGPLIVHRLDMSTSGIMLLGKTAEACKRLQSQFIKRTVQKRYVAVLEGLISEDSGVIDLPLRVDFDDRPRQLVCHEHGKKARTEWQVVQRINGLTRVYFKPITGRTHQLRVHAAHHDGLNIPIKGDDLYGKRSDRLYLHAGKIEFMHPFSDRKIKLEVEAEF